MNTPVVTGIVVALAVAVVGIFFLFPGLSPFGSPESSATQATTDQTDQQTQTAPTTNPETVTQTTTMPSDQLEITDQTVGTGATAVAGDQVTINYVGTLADGTVFDASANHGQPFSFTLGAGQVIPGFDQGVTGMKVGGKRTIVIPPSLGYGSAGAGTAIPPNATITFQVDLLSVTPAPAQ